MNEYTITVIAILTQAIVKIVCFLLGYLTIKLGYKLINDGIKGEFKFTVDYKGIKGGLISSTPGLLFILLGVILIGYAMYVSKKTYLESETPIQNERNKVLPHPPPHKDTLIDTIN